MLGNQAARTFGATMVQPMPPCLEVKTGRRLKARLSVHRKTAEDYVTSPSALPEAS